MLSPLEQGWFQEGLRICTKPQTLMAWQGQSEGHGTAKLVMGRYRGHH